MGGILGRMSTIVRAKMNKALDSAEDPNETLDFSYEKQLQMLQNVRRGVADMVTAKSRVQLQQQQLQEKINKTDEQARQALSMGREDLARLALTRKQEYVEQSNHLLAQIEDMQREQQKLVDGEQRLSAKIESFRTRKETIKAQYYGGAGTGEDRRGGQRSIRGIGRRQYGHSARRRQDGVATGAFGGH